MRIKTSKNTLDQLAETTKNLKFSSNAETLKLAISFALSKYSVEDIESIEYDQQGFEIDTHILFGEELDYYYQVIKFYFKADHIKAEHICVLIEAGFAELSKVLKINKYDIAKVVAYILEV